MTVLPLASLRSRLFVVVVAAILPFVLYAVLLAARERSVAGSSLRAESLDRARATARTLDDRLAQVDRMLDSAMVRVRRPEDDTRPLRLADSVSNPLAGALTIAVLDKDGARAGVLLGEPSRVDAIPQARRTSVVGVAFGSARGGDPKAQRTFVDEGAFRDAADSIAMIIVRPIQRSRTRCDCLADAPGALVAVLSDKALQILLGSDSLPEGGVAVLVSSSGTLLGRPLAPDRWTDRANRDTALLATGVEREGVLELKGRDDITRSVGFAALKLLPWRVYVGVPRSNMSVLPDNQLRDILLLAVLALAIAGVGVVIASRAFSRPVQTLVADTQRLAAGALTHRTEVADEPGELGTLGVALNTLAADLETRRRTAQDELRRTAVAFDASPVAMWVTDASPDSPGADRIQQANAAAAALFGISGTALLGQRDTDLLDAAAAPLLTAAPVTPTVQSGRARLRRAAGAPRELLLHVSLVPHPRTPLRVVTAVELPAAQSATPGSAPNARHPHGASTPPGENALVTFSAQVAAEFTDVMQGLTGFTQLAFESADDPDMRNIAVERIRDLAIRGQALTRQLQAFGQRDVLHCEVLDANDILTEAVQAMAETLGRDVELDILYNVSPAPVFADAQLLSQVVTTLIANARDAMPAGGTLTLASTFVEVPLNPAETYAAPAGRYIVLTVADTGMGMSADARARMFDPFWSTKRQQGGGTGLGLAAVSGIAKQHGWAIGVESEPEVGTAISLYMPVAVLPAADAAGSDDQPSLEIVPARSR
ncbi:MAG: ATP-binding protein [Gemmatimonadaceae bacterium]|nr:ATP-binding protein [Gemmatimonadaceae bacterium]